MDVFDRAQENDELFRKNALNKQLEKTRSLLSSAIPTNRECEDCGKPIPKARLKANPAAIRCVPCQTKYERKES
jgi:DnaK suppressor protein